MSKVLVVAPHPDDEILGCGGSLLRHSAAGDSISIVYVTQMLLDSGYTRERIDSRAREIDQIAEQLRATVFQLSYATAKLTDHDKISLIPEISKIFEETLPEIVYLPNKSDAHSDHGISFDAAFACTKIFRCSSVNTTLVYETLSETDFSAERGSDVFVPNYFIDISPYIDKKIDLMKVYASELGEHPFPRSIASIKALATLRGSAAGVDCAESFQLLKHIR